MNEVLNDVDRCIELFTTARERVAEAMPMLYRIFEDNSWEGRFSSFAEFVDACQIDRGYASRLVAVFEHYSIVGGIDLGQLSEVNPNKLYAAMKLKGSVQKQFHNALTLPPNQLRAKLSVKEDGSEHECEPITFCRVCHRKM